MRGRRQPVDPQARESAVTEMRSEGQRMLCHVIGPLDAIAAECEAKSKQSVLDWRNGTARPSHAARARMWAAFGIPVAAWDTPPHALPVVPDAPAGEAFDPDAPAASTLDECRALIAVVKRDRMRPNIGTGERVRLSAAEAQLLKLRAELELRHELSEDRYVREHPAWLRAKREIARVLVQYPEAARAVAEALSKLNV